MRSILFCSLAALALTTLAACNQNGSTASHTASQNSVSHYKMTGNRSADPLGSYTDDNPNSISPAIGGRYASGAQGNGMTLGNGLSRSGGANH